MVRSKFTKTKINQKGQISIESLAILGIILIGATIFAVFYLQSTKSQIADVPGTDIYNQFEQMLTNGGTTGGGTTSGTTSVPPHCSDGDKNYDETGVDCGGVDCPACPLQDHCFNHTKDEDEADVDCGGVDCPACPPQLFNVPNCKTTYVESMGGIVTLCLKMTAPGADIGSTTQCTEAMDGNVCMTVSQASAIPNYIEEYPETYPQQKCVYVPSMDGNVCFNIG